MSLWKKLAVGTAIAGLAMTTGVGTASAGTKPAPDVRTQQATSAATCQAAGQTCLVDRSTNPIRVWVAPSCGWQHLPAGWRGTATHLITAGQPVTMWLWKGSWQQGTTVPAWTERSFGGRNADLHAIDVKC